MGFEISNHLLRGLHHLMSKTEFDNPPFRKKLLSPEYGHFPAYVEAEISEYGLSIKARQQPLIKGITMFDKNLFDSHKFKTIFNRFDRCSCSSLIKKITVDKHTFEMIAIHDLRVVHVNTSEEFSLNGNSIVIITCGDAALIANVTGLCKSRVDTDMSLLKFELAFQPEPTTKI